MNETDSDPASPETRPAAVTRDEYDTPCVQTQVFTAAIIALIVGFLIGLMCRKKEETLQEKYLEAPLNDLRKAISSLSQVAAKKAAGGGEVAADMIDTLSDKIRSVVKSL